MIFIPILFNSGVTFGQIVPSAGKWIEGRRYIPYKIRAKDTWTNIASSNETTINELQHINKGIIDLKIGQIIYIPAKTEKSNDQKNIPDKEPKAIIKNDNFQYHTVKKGETLFHISQVYHQPVAKIMEWNNLTSNNIPLGGELIVGKLNSETKVAVNKTNEEKEKPAKAIITAKENNKTIVSEPVKSAKETSIEQSDKTDAKKDKHYANLDSLNTKVDKDQDSGSVNKIIETGVATWLNDQDLNQNKFYALHRTAPIGTIIKVTNRMNNNSVFVKVVGVLPNTGDNDNIIIKITSAAAQRIGAIDQKFTAELTYGLSH